MRFYTGVNHLGKGAKSFLLEDIGKLENFVARSHEHPSSMRRSPHSLS